MSYASELPMGIQGGPTMPMPPGSPPMDSPLNGIDFNILQLNVGAQTSNPITTIPSTLVAVNPYPQSQANLNRNIMFTADSMMVMDGPFYFNGLSFDMMRIDYQIPLNQTEIWTLMDSTMVAHPFHVHDVQFFILDRDGNSPPPEERGWKDVVLVQPNETVRIIMKFTDFVDSVIPYMYHCHILMHEDDGMMGQFVVMPQGWVNINSLPKETEQLIVYPNPTNGIFTIDINDAVPTDYTMEIRNALGEIIHKDKFISQGIKTQKTISLGNTSSGVYSVILQSKNKNLIYKIVVQ